MLTQAALRSATPPSDTLPVPPTPSATVVLLSKIAIDPALNLRREVDPAIRESTEASMRDRLSRGLHPQESPVWAVAAVHHQEGAHEAREADEGEEELAMVRPITPRRDDYAEMRTITTMRNVVIADRAHDPEWRRETTDLLEALIELLSRRPPPLKPTTSAE